MPGTVTWAIPGIKLSELSTIYNAAVTYLDGNDHEIVVAYLAKDAIITDMVAPLSRPVRRETLAMCAWIVTAVNVFHQPRHYHAGDTGIKFGELPIGLL